MRSAGFLRVLGRCVLVLLSVMLFSLCVWAVLFHAPYLAVLSLLGAVVLSPLALGRPVVRRAKVIAGVVLLVVTVLTAWLPVSEVNRQVAVLRGKPRYSTADKLGVWGLNLVMAKCGFAAYPEVAVETALLVLPRPAHDTFVVRSDFPLRSSVVRARLRDFARRLPSSRQDEQTFSVRQADLWAAVAESGESFVSAPASSKFVALQAAYWDSRCALALNPVTVLCRARREGGQWLMDVRAIVWVGYAEDGEAELVPPVKFGRGAWRFDWSGLVMYERLFWVLQQDSVGWLHPYHAEYRFTIRSDDRRLRS